MRLKMFFLFILLTPVLVFSQSVKVKKETSRINGENAEGYEVILQASEEDVKQSLSKFLKGVGKIKVSDEMITIHGATLGSKKYTLPVYSNARQLGNLTVAWIGINSKEWGKEAGSVGKDLENLTYDFGVNFYRQKIQMQIDESLRALQIVEKQQSRLTNQNKDLLNKIENNKRDKIQLEKSLDLNKGEMETLSKKLAENRQGQDSIAIAAAQIKKVVEMHQESQRKVH